MSITFCWDRIVSMIPSYFLEKLLVFLVLVWYRGLLINDISLQLSDPVIAYAWLGDVTIREHLHDPNLFWIMKLNCYFWLSVRFPRKPSIQESAVVSLTKDFTLVFLFMPGSNNFTLFLYITTPTLLYYLRWRSTQQFCSSILEFFL